MNTTDHHAALVDGLPYWHTATSQESLRSLDAGTSHRIAHRPDIAVVGGGAVGLAIAAMCVRAGLGNVAVLERGNLAGGPSGRAGGVLAPEAHAWTDPPSLVALGRRSFALTRRLDDEWGNELGVRDLDCLLAGRRLPEVTTPLTAQVAVLDEQQVRDREPALRGVTGGVLIHEQGHVNPLRFAAALARHAGTVVTNAEVEASTVARRRVVTLHTRLGDVHPGVVIYATGGAPTPDVTVPHTSVKGHLAVTEPVACSLRTQIVTAGGGALPLPDGRLLTGGTIDDPDSAPGVRRTVVEGIRRGLDTIVPAAAAAQFSHVWTCYRPATPDRLPIIDRMPGTDNAWFTSGHFRTGLLMAVATGEIITKWVSSGTRPALAEPFTLARFDRMAGSGGQPQAPA